MTVRMLRLRLVMRLGLLSPLVRLARWSQAGERAVEDDLIPSRDALPAPGVPATVGQPGAHD